MEVERLANPGSRTSCTPETLSASRSDASRPFTHAHDPGRLGAMGQAGGRATRRLEITGRRLEALRDRVGAVVSSDDNYLTHGGGVSQAIWTAAGPALARFVAENAPRLALGDVFPTPAGKLKADEILHAVTIDFDANRKIDQGITTLYARVLTVARERGHDKLALPLLGTGAAELPAEASLRALRAALGAMPVGGPPTHLLVCIPDSSLRDRARAEIKRAEASEAVARAGLHAAIRELSERFPQTPLARVWREFSRGTEGNLHLAVLLEALLALVRPEWGLDALADEARFLRNALAHRRAAGTTADHLAVPLQLARGLLRAHPRQMAITPELTREMRRRPRPSERTNRTGDLFEPSPGVWALADAAVESQALARETDPHHDLAPACVSSVPEPRVVASPPPPPPVMEPTGTAHVRALHSFLLRRLSEERRSHLDALLVERGYKGAAEFRLLEYLVREDPLELLRDLFTRHDLSACLKDAYGLEAGPAWTHTRVANELLRNLGFRSPARPIGLRHAQRGIQRARAKMLGGDAVGARGAVAHVAAHLEYVCQVMLRFVAHAAYDEAPERLLAEWKVLPTDQPLARAGLGSLFTFVGKLDKHVKKDRPARLQFVAAELLEQPLFPRGVGGLAELRNAFVHYRDASDAHALLEKAERFLALAEEFVIYLAAPATRIFPSVVAVTEIRFDRWGRRIVTVVDDAEAEDVVFTSQDIKPGELYFLHALSNPMRVDPILVPAGDLTGPQDENPIG